MKEETKFETWLIKDTDGEYVTVRADNWEVSSNGLVYFRDGVKVAHFIRWVSARKLNA